MNELTTQTNIEPIVKLVTDSLTSQHSQVAYKYALEKFLSWWISNDKPPLIKSTVNSYKREVLEQPDPITGKVLSPSSINLHISAIRKLAGEAADNNLIPQEQANGISRIKGVKSAGVRTGNWLDRKQAQALINLPDISTLKGLRDRTILALLVGAGLRRSELANLKFDHIQQREGRWAIVDLIGKRNRIRTIPIPSWVKVVVDEWANAADISTGCILRPVNRGDNITGEHVTTQLIYRVCEEYTNKLGFTSIAPHDLRRTFAKLAHKGGAGVEQIQLTLGHGSMTTTERYLGVEQDLTNAPCDYLGLKIKADKP